ncbi:putative Secreted trypsin-like serine protease [Vibrio nigripulchritudo SO65]|uniref:trypsin-like serine protease n=1 Tax=Vibrio nigripulchritudo TaxID=28173 RepID=UPI0003B1F125|nr:trypsin-like serine protease [Vibrio nigripulchritudo]CCN38534.1 putative Secreted trypsin-like serine protease [Vibrio nigripulchritudo AM115]CCN43058.1 putative Secreted trypsin-like serine protease [Vibrio nigripulchritudo FTn2]CCN67421.1 putative Secreted trypsin-like serine protease [Vibrio nigripulchritudo POn4]CCN77168.1 putative Secreted trypsin-like serine protease [Vibrio nigripulchritudo SO65]
MKSQMKLSMLAVATSLILPATASASDTISPRIVGGSDANTADWPFYAQIVPSSSERSFCGGSYIGDGFVLTAAHCLRNKHTAFFDVKLGGYKFENKEGTRFDVKRVFMHPDYVAEYGLNDIAIIELKTIPQGFSAVNLGQNNLSQYVRVGDLLTVAGLGRTAEKGPPPTVLQEVDVPLVSKETCNAAGGPYQNGYIGKSAFCAGYLEGGKDSCSGDSGGPIVVNQGGQVSQLGVVSWGRGCARPGKYGVYSDVTHYHDWINGVLTNPDDQVAFSYKKSLQVEGFELGQAKKHFFTIRNTGTADINITSATLTGAGVAETPAMTIDRCTTETLLAGRACSIQATFGATAAGTAEVKLDFTTDRTGTTVHTAVIKATVTDSSGPTNPGDGCAQTWQSGKAYQSGELVSWKDRIWKARHWTKEEPADTGKFGAWLDQGADTCTGA